MIFVDSSFFIGLALESDQWHERALELIPQLDECDKMVSGFIISETVTMVGGRSGGKSGKMVYDYIMDNCNVFTHMGNQSLMKQFKHTLNMMELYLSLIR